MENDMGQQMDPFTKTVADACHILSGWKNKYGNRDTRLTEANDGVAFAMTGAENKKGKKIKDITCYKCKKIDRYANECDEDEETVRTSNKKG